MSKSALYFILMFLGAITFAAATTWWNQTLGQDSVTINKSDPVKVLDSMRTILKGKIKITELSVDSLPFKLDTIPGDVNKDGILDVRDFAAIMQVVLYSQYADMNNDGSIDVNDIAYLKEYVFERGPYPKAPFFSYRLVGKGLPVDTTKK